jgi:ribosomal protein S12 methylthiotransferase accessory factor
VSTVEGTGTFLLSETIPTVLNGRLNELVCPLIDGTRTADDIADALRGQLSIAEVYFTLTTLEQRGFIEEAVDEIPVPVAAFWRALDTDPRVALQRLADTPVRVFTIGAVDEAAVVRALESAGVRVSAEADVTIVATDDYRRSEIDAIDADVREKGAALLLVKPVGWLPWIGPILVPDKGGCWRCMVDRIRMNYTTDTFVEERTGTTPVTSIAALPASVDAALARFAVEVAKWIASDQPSPLLNALVSMPLTSIEQTQHMIPRRTTCQRCGDPAFRERRAHERDPEPFLMVSQPILHSVDGGHRTATAEQTLERYSDLVSPITGVVSTIERV